MKNKLRKWLGLDKDIHDLSLWIIENYASKIRVDSHSEAINEMQRDMTALKQCVEVKAKKVKRA